MSVTDGEIDFLKHLQDFPAWHVLFVSVVIPDANFELAIGISGNYLPHKVNDKLHWIQ